MTSILPRNQVSGHAGGIHHDIGPFATVNTDLLAAAGTLPVIVSDLTQESTEQALYVLQVVTDQASHAPRESLAQIGVIVVNTTSRKRAATPAAVQLTRTAMGAPVLALEWDHRLSVPGPIDPAGLTPATVTTIAAILQAFAI